jgi:arsenate reductase
MKILIVCTGNSCRSQMAHGYLHSLDKDLKVFSAGTIPADEVNPKAVKVMKEVGIDISKHTPRHVNEYLPETWDFVITVCGGAKESCPFFTGNVKNRMHIGFDDPWEARGTEEYVLSEYRRVRDEIMEAFGTFYTENLKSN